MTETSDAPIGVAQVDVKEQREHRHDDDAAAQPGQRAEQAGAERAAGDEQPPEPGLSCEHNVVGMCSGASGGEPQPLESALGCSGPYFAFDQ